MGHLAKFDNPIVAQQKLEQSISFSERWEEELKQKLFAEDENKTSSNDVLEYMTEKTNIHHKRPGEE